MSATLNEIYSLKKLWSAKISLLLTRSSLKEGTWLFQRCRSYLWCTSSHSVQTAIIRQRFHYEDELANFSDWFYFPWRSWHLSACNPFALLCNFSCKHEKGI